MVGPGGHGRLNSHPINRNPMGLNSAEALAALSLITRSEQKVLIGRLGRDPELRTFPSGAYKAEASIAINRLGEKDQSDWFKVEIWDAEGQRFTDTARKGDLIEVSGRVKLEQWNDKQTGKLKWQWLIRADDWRVVRRPGEAVSQAPAAARQAAASAGSGNATAAPPPAWNSNAADSFDEEEVPF